ncbi:MAG: tetratricopeptide repeat protein [Spirochaetota bacterium]
MYNKRIQFLVSCIFLTLVGLSNCSEKKVIEKIIGTSKELEEKCAKNNYKACTSVGVRKAFGTWGYQKDYPSAVTFMKKGCDGKDYQGCKELGVMYMYGRGVEKDYAKAKELFEPACAKEIANACHYIGDFYKYGRGFAKDLETAKKYYQKACDAGSKSSCKLAEE